MSGLWQRSTEEDETFIEFGLPVVVFMRGTQEKKCAKFYILWDKRNP